MADWDKAVVSKLIAENQEFRALHEEHEELEKRLASFASLHYLTPKEEQERRSLQKRKLAGKDRMEAIIASVGKGRS